MEALGLGGDAAAPRLGAARSRSRRSSATASGRSTGSRRHDAGGSAVTRQALYAVAGSLVFIGALFVDPSTYLRLRRPIYFGTLGLMVFVLAAGAATRGSRRWIDVGFFTFQPSEFGKVLFVLALAGFLAERSRSMSLAGRAARRARVRPAPDRCSSSSSRTSAPRSSTLAALAAVLFVAGVRWSHLAVLLTLTVVAALAVLWLLPASGVNVLKPYQAARLTGFTHPSNDPQGATYNLRAVDHGRRRRAACAAAACSAPRRRG